MCAQEGGSVDKADEARWLAIEYGDTEPTRDEELEADRNRVNDGRFAAVVAGANGAKP